MAKQRREKSESIKNTQPVFRQVFFVLLIFTAGAGCGWLVKYISDRGSHSDSASKGISALRLDGYHFISPLLACNTGSDSDAADLNELKSKLQVLTDSQKSTGKISDVSIYFRDLSLSQSLHINPDAMYYPASMAKVPLTMTIYKQAESDPTILQKKVMVPQDKNYNTSDLEVQPLQTMAPGTEYSVEEAIEKLIVYSDNNSFYALATIANPDLYKETYSDLKIPYRDDPNSSPDYLTTEQFSYFFRVLYNSTYLSREYSEKMLGLLSRVDFREGLVRQLPSGVEVAHKFGIFSQFTAGGQLTSRELHDCGIVYNGDKPYLVCVMTKSSGVLQEAEKAMQDISSLIYQDRTGK